MNYLDKKTCMVGFFDGQRVITKPSHNYRPIRYPLRGLVWICMNCGETKK